MRGRKPFPLTLSPGDLVLLEEVARSQSRPWYQVRRARTLLAIAAGERVQTVAFQAQCNVDTVRRTCRRYQISGLAATLAHPLRSGRPTQISPPATCADCRVGVPGAGGEGVAHHALVE